MFELESTSVDTFGTNTGSGSGYYDGDGWGDGDVNLYGNGGLDINQSENYYGFKDYGYALNYVRGYCYV